MRWYRPDAARLDGGPVHLTMVRNGQALAFQEDAPGTIRFHQPLETSWLAFDVAGIIL